MLYPNTFRFYLVVLLVTLISCRGDNSPEGADSSDDSVENNTIGNQSDLKDSLPPIGSLTGDTLNIGGKFVLFFGPVETADSTQKIGPAELRKYKAISASLLDSLSSNTDIKAVYSTAGVFRIYTSGGSAMVIAKSALNEETGILITDGSQPPTIKKGVFSSTEYYQLIKNYFFLK